MRRYSKKVVHGKSKKIRECMTFINNLESPKSGDDTSKCFKPWQKSSR
jgi:hypothetical protein